MKIEITVAPSRFPSEEAIQKRVTAQFHVNAKDAVEKLRDQFSEVLEPGAEEDVGASGAASENINWRDVSTSQEVVFEVYEGSATIANRMIRQGIRKGIKVPYATLRTWAANKGLRLYYDYKNERTPEAVLDRFTSKNGVAYERSRWFGRVGIKPNSALKPSMLTKKAIYAIRTALYKEGTNRPGANWYNLPPSGAGRFNYKNHVFVTRKDNIKGIMTDFGTKVARDIDENLGLGV